MLKNIDVAIAWTSKEKASGKNFRTHNGRAWSYSLLVAEWTTNGTMVIYDYTNSAGNFVSRSTTKHVSALVEAAYKHAPGAAPLVITSRVPRRPYRPRRTHGGQSNNRSR